MAGNRSTEIQKVAVAHRTPVPQWLAALRHAGQQEFTPSDLKAIIRRQIELAKSGTGIEARHALTFVTEVLLGGMLPGLMTDFDDMESGDRAKLMECRAQAGLPLRD